MKNLHFGIEIEMTGITRAKAAEIIAEYFETYNFSHNDDAYDTYTANDMQGRVWKAMGDSSIKPQKKVDGCLVEATSYYRTEVVSPILNYNDIETVQEIVRILRKAGALVNGSCGIHIHVGAESFTAQNLANIVNLMASKEDMIYKAVKVTSSREFNYCKKVSTRLIQDIKTCKPKTREAVADIWYKQASGESRNSHYNSSRYHGLNLHSTFTKGSVEFRIFNGTLHAGEIKAYIQFCLAMAHQALTLKRASAKPTVTDNDKYAFRCWMLRMGLIGDEFKTCRHHFLKNLTGNSAWRHGAAAV